MATMIQSFEQPADDCNQGISEITPEQRAAEYAAVDRDLAAARPSRAQVLVPGEDEKI